MHWNFSEEQLDRTLGEYITRSLRSGRRAAAMERYAATILDFLKSEVAKEFKLVQED